MYDMLCVLCKRYILYGMVWYGMVWYGMVWYGMVWYGMVWYGMYAMVSVGCRMMSEVSVSETKVRIFVLKQ